MDILKSNLDDSNEPDVQIINKEMPPEQVIYEACLAVHDEKDLCLFFTVNIPKEKMGEDGEPTADALETALAGIVPLNDIKWVPANSVAFISKDDITNPQAIWAISQQNSEGGE